MVACLQMGAPFYGLRLPLTSVKGQARLRLETIGNEDAEHPAGHANNGHTKRPGS